MNTCWIRLKIFWPLIDGCLTQTNFDSRPRTSPKEFSVTNHIKFTGFQPSTVSIPVTHRYIHANKGSQCLTPAPSSLLPALLLLLFSLGSVPHTSVSLSHPFRSHLFLAYETPAQWRLLCMWVKPLQKEHEPNPSAAAWSTQRDVWDGMVSTSLAFPYWIKALGSGGGMYYVHFNV